MSLRPLRAALAGWSPQGCLAVEPLQAIAAAWPGIVGEHVAAQATPLDVSGDALVVGTTSSAWSQQLHFLGPRILMGLRALPEAAGLERLVFRVGGRRRSQRRGGRAPGGPPARRPQPGPAPAPASDVWEAFERVRRRLAGRSADERCPRCEAPQATPGWCAPCAERSAADRFVAVQRALYLTPWLGYAEVREAVPDLEPAEFERARRHLLGRWWQMLERIRRRGQVGSAGLERQLASSYVLLQSRLPPDRLSSAVVRNVLGPELERLVWGAPADLSKNDVR